MQGLIQWKPKCLLRTIIGRKEREAKWITNGWVPIQLLNLLERAYMHLKRQMVLLELSTESMAHG